MILAFKHLTNFGSVGIWFSMSFSNFVVCVFGLWVFKVKGWNRHGKKITNNT